MPKPGVPVLLLGDQPHRWLTPCAWALQQIRAGYPAVEVMSQCFSAFSFSALTAALAFSAR